MLCAFLVIELVIATALVLTLSILGDSGDPRRDDAAIEP